MRRDGNAKRTSGRTHPLLLAAPMVLLLVLSALAGCGGDSPESALMDHLGAWEKLDWEAYKETVAPSRKLTKEQEELAKQKFEQVEVKFDDIQTETKYDSGDKNKATVTLTGGKITYTAVILGKKKTEVQDISKMEAKDRPVFDLVKVDGVWYVDTPLG